MSIVVYSAVWCSYCKRVKQLLESKNIKYEVVDIDEYPEKMMVLVNQGMRTIPQVFIEGESIGGYTETYEYFKNLV